MYKINKTTYPDILSHNKRYIKSPDSKTIYQSLYKTPTTIQRVPIIILSQEGQPVASLSRRRDRSQN